MIFSSHSGKNSKRKGNKRRARKSVKGVQMEMMKLLVRAGLVGTVTRGVIYRCGRGHSERFSDE